LGKQNFH